MHLASLKLKKNHALKKRKDFKENLLTFIPSIIDFDLVLKNRECLIYVRGSLCARVSRV